MWGHIYISFHDNKVTQPLISVIEGKSKPENPWLGKLVYPFGYQEAFRWQCFPQQARTGRKLAEDRKREEIRRWRFLLWRVLLDPGDDYTVGEHSSFHTMSSQLVYTCFKIFHFSNLINSSLVMTFLHKIHTYWIICSFVWVLFKKWIGLWTSFI